MINSSYCSKLIDQLRLKKQLLKYCLVLVRKYLSKKAIKFEL